MYGMIYGNFKQTAQVTVPKLDFKRIIIYWRQACGGKYREVKERIRKRKKMPVQQFRLTFYCQPLGQEKRKF